MIRPVHRWLHMPVFAILMLSATGLRADAADLADRIHGLLLGAAIGDAVAGPVEFQEYEKVRGMLPDCRSWPKGRRLEAEDIRQLARTLKLMPYAPLRPIAEPYGQWTAKAPPGTVTDDTRMKMILIQAIRQNAVTLEGLATAFAQAGELPQFNVRPEYATVRDESLREFQSAARWVLRGDKSPGSKPAVRIWGGLPTCCGQMTTTPLACLFPGDPNNAYITAHQITFIDQGTARDTNAALTAGLAAAIVDNEGSAKQRYKRMRKTMIDVDPYKYAEVPFIERPVTRWIKLAEGCVAESNGSPATLYAKLVEAYHPQYYWEARHTFGCAWALLNFCEWNPLAAMHLAMDMGHDTDSVAQVIGLMAGAVEGTAVFPASLRQPVEALLKSDYDVDLAEWTRLMRKSKKSSR